ncbi:hypothetical protein LTR97_007643 [Elasticomyces elasticus]|uniref:Uncharacterized protein n=1 Tax=Elasticomyces elasticus TaxID=574655 RepID=A0AAN7WEY6_9PEZI|nr:hypothetical protein LTR97_007643 [Elasticomyces elasticus]
MSDRRTRRPLYAPPPPPSNHRSALGFWVPVVVTTTLALGGLAAWVWSERSEHDDDEGYPPTARPDVKPQPYPPPQQQGGGGGLPNYSGPLPSQSAGAQGQPAPAPSGGEAASYYGNSRSGQQHEGYVEDDGQTFFGQVRGAMRRTPSPQQFYDQASKQVSAGLAAAGGVLGSIMEDGDEHEQDSYGRRGGEERRGGGGEVREERREEQREGFSDHERWSEEAEEKERDRGVVEVESERRADAARSGRGTSDGKQRQRKTVAVVVSADTNMDGKMDEEDIIYDQHASILSHLPEHHNPERTDLFILIYAPGLLTLPPITYRPTTPHLDITDTGSNLGSSYSQVNTSTNTPQAVTPSEELQSISPKIDAEPDFKSPGQQFDALYTQALALVDHPSKILCFTTASGYTSLLRHLAPQLAYVSDLLAGEEGRVIAKLRGWVGSAVLVVGDDGTGGLAADSDETEDERAGGEGGAGGVGAGFGGRKRKEEQWYERSDLVGLGKGLEVVDVARVGDDWGKRVGGRE